MVRNETGQFHYKKKIIPLTIISQFWDSEDNFSRF